MVISIFRSIGRLTGAGAANFTGSVGIGEVNGDEA